ncbi:unnamed protein product [Didymodactylos carnosus]|uniref:Microtubule-associated protein n=1 Tax=Didymodactylos carnosus TaxID=1234261 RepID=A0A814ASY3_9BILA|nr:unnamed protein product [Didymodactylos carnosus]CAF0916321.1 unnamed protein product [Didymodactylos carnosus]CAF3636550.1 unnamed protein product [Didymodactylos carnosus]CAF3696362.1 unnamed protein product [Didymodactylos carnosus]
MSTVLPTIVHTQQPKQRRISTITKNSRGQVVRVIVVSNNKNNQVTTDGTNDTSDQQRNGIIKKPYNKERQQQQQLQLKTLLNHSVTRKNAMVNGASNKLQNPDTVTPLNGSNSTRANSSESGRIARKLWWSPKRHEIQVKSEDTKYQNIGPKVGSLANINYKPGGGNVVISGDKPKWTANAKVNSLQNANWSPPLPRIAVKSEKLTWNAEPKIGSMANINYRPGGGSISIRDEQLDFRDKATPRVDCGFVDDK